MYPVWTLLVQVILLQKAIFVSAEPVEPEACILNGEPDFCPVTEICCTTYCCPKNFVCANDSCLSYWVIIVPSVVGLGILFTITLCCINKIKNKRWTSD